MFFFVAQCHILERTERFENFFYWISKIVLKKSTKQISVSFSASWYFNYQLTKLLLHLCGLKWILNTLSKWDRATPITSSPWTHNVVFFLNLKRFIICYVIFSKKGIIMIKTKTSTSVTFKIKYCIWKWCIVISKYWMFQMRQKCHGIILLWLHIDKLHIVLIKSATIT